MIDAAGKFYLDTQSLDSLRIQAGKNPNAALPQVARQFESVLMGMMLQSMRDATPQDGPLDSEQTKTYLSMFDQQLSQLLSKKGMGLAEVMVKQLDRTLPKAPLQTAAKVQASPAPAAQAPVHQAPAPQASSTGHRKSFISKLLPYAREAADATGIPAKFMLGQAALETGWGRHEIRRANGQSSHNLFGIKADKHWKGPVVTALTTEYVNGAAKKVYQNFRAYSSYAESFRDYASLLKSRYSSAAASATDAAGFAKGMKSYATDPKYSDKLMHVFNGIIA